MDIVERMHNIKQLEVAIQKHEEILHRLRKERLQAGQELSFTRYTNYSGRKIQRGTKGPIFTLRLANAYVKVNADFSLVYHLPNYHVGETREIVAIDTSGNLRRPWRWWNGAAAAASEAADAADAAQTKLPLEQGATNVNP